LIRCSRAGKWRRLLFDIVPYLLARESPKGGNPFKINQDFPQNCLVSGTRDMISTHLQSTQRFCRSQQSLKT
jgi:hypothetical protein